VVVEDSSTPGALATVGLDVARDLEGKTAGPRQRGPARRVDEDFLLALIRTVMSRFVGNLRIAGTTAKRKIAPRTSRGHAGDEQDPPAPPGAIRSAVGLLGGGSRG
jgi:hypothetical protein